jgi:hypothetical protein
MAFPIRFCNLIEAKHARHDKTANTAQYSASVENKDKQGNDDDRNHDHLRRLSTIVSLEKG